MSDKCERCGVGPNGTASFNHWGVDIDGECPLEGETDIGEEVIENVCCKLCDACSLKPDRVVWMVAYALGYLRRELEAHN